MNTTEKYVARPGVFYNDSFYSWDKKAGEFSLQELSDTLTQDGTTDTLLEITEACYDNHQTNREEFYNARIYRLKNGAQAEALGLTDYFFAGGICVIEWSENIADVLPENCKTVTIRKLDANTREIVAE